MTSRLVGFVVVVEKRTNNIEIEKEEGGGGAQVEHFILH